MVRGAIWGMRGAAATAASASAAARKCLFAGRAARGEQSVGVFSSRLRRSLRWAREEAGERGVTPPFSGPSGTGGWYFGASGTTMGRGRPLRALVPGDSGDLDRGWRMTETVAKAEPSGRLGDGGAARLSGAGAAAGGRAGGLAGRVTGGWGSAALWAGGAPGRGGSSARSWRMSSRSAAPSSSEAATKRPPNLGLLFAARATDL